MKCASKWYAYEINSGYPVVEKAVSLKDLLGILKIFSNTTQHEFVINDSMKQWVQEHYRTKNHWVTVKIKKPVPLHETMKILA